MIYELRGKIPKNSSFIYSEDVLTGLIFGNLRYFSNQTLLINFLNEAKTLDNNYANISIENKFQINFWEKYRSKSSNSYNEPDLVLQNEDIIIIIECKYFSILDEQEDEQNNKLVYKNQLIRYSKIIDEYYENKKNKMLIYLTNDKIKPEEILKNTINNINKNIILYWLSWDKLYKSMLKHNDNTSNNEKILFDDLMELLIKRRLLFFNGFNIQKVLYNKFYHKEYMSEINIIKNKWRYKK